MTSPLIMRLAIDTKNMSFCVNSSGTKWFEKTSDSGPSWAATSKSLKWTRFVNSSKLHLQSPLDWRLVWGGLLDRRLSIHEWNGWFDRSYILSRHRPETMFQLGVLGRQTAKDREHTNLIWSKAMELSPWIASRAASLIALDTSDEEIPSQCFPARAKCALLNFWQTVRQGAFPDHEWTTFWKDIEEVALAMDPTDSNRYVWLARAPQISENLY